jgi:hypothetical protein
MNYLPESFQTDRGFLWKSCMSVAAAEEFAEDPKQPKPHLVLDLFTQLDYY